MITRPQLRAARALLGWSQRELADAAGLTVDHIKAIESGRLDPRASMLAQIEEAFRRNDVVFLDPDDVKPGGYGVRFRR
jgi:transcriptional regulator with XRE-family HTH domain